MDFGYRQTRNDWLFRQKCRDFLIWQKLKQKHGTPVEYEAVRVEKQPESKNGKTKVEATIHRTKNGPKGIIVNGHNQFNHPVVVGVNGQRNQFRIDDSKVENAIRHKTKSIYQVDYLGAPPGINLRTAYFDVTNLNERGEKPRPPRTVNTNSRISYQVPQGQPIDLQCDTSRYGCNANFSVPAIGVVPLLNEGDVDMTSLVERGARTTYSREYVAKRPFTAPGTRFGNMPGARAQTVPKIKYIEDDNQNLEGMVELNRDEVFRTARSARVNESLTYRKPLKSTLVLLREPTKYWAGPE